MATEEELFGEIYREEPNTGGLAGQHGSPGPVRRRGSKNERKNAAVTRVIDPQQRRMPQNGNQVQRAQSPAQIPQARPQPIQNTPQKPQKQQKRIRRPEKTNNIDLPKAKNKETAREKYEKVMLWLYEHPFVIVLIGVLLIAIGLLVNRYISTTGGVLLLALGWLMSRDDEKDPLVCYAVAMAVIIIPYCF